MEIRDKNSATKSSGTRGWIAVDFDGTLVTYDPKHSVSVVGKVIEPMIYRIKQWLQEGIEVRIFTARATDPEFIPPIQQWMTANGLPLLAVTNRKDYDLLQMWDDRAIQIETNTGVVLTPREYISLNVPGWIGVELDGTLAHYSLGQDMKTIGTPIDKMRIRVQQMLMIGADIRLFTARANDPAMLPVIETWLKEHRLQGMKITSEKDFAMSQFWDDRGVHVVTNRGEIVAQLTSMVPERKYPAG